MWTQGHTDVDGNDANRPGKSMPTHPSIHPTMASSAPDLMLVPVVCDAVMDLLGGAAAWFCRISPDEQCRGDGID